MTMRASDMRCEDLAYTKQFFSVTHIGHTRPTAEFGSPTMVWHVSFWPRRHKDPHEFDMCDISSLSGLKSSEKIRDEHGMRFHDVADDFNKLLLHLQQRGCVRGSDPGPPFALEKPLDWEIDTLNGPFDGQTERPVEQSFHGFAAETCGFTLWWPDTARGKRNLLGDASDVRPWPTDVRVRVQAEMTEDFSSITFFIDAGKPWDQEPVDSADAAQARGVLGARRRDIFRHIENIRTICENRLRPEGNALVDLAAIPERICGVPPEPSPEIAAKTEEDCEKNPRLRELLNKWKTETGIWLDDEMKAGSSLLAGADYVYKTLWDEFCRDFEFNLCDVAGRTNEVFANFRGLVMATNGIDDPKVESASRSSTANSGTRPFPRFNGGGDGYNADVIEPNAVVKAFMPFMRRFRSEADWRDWIACGIFDWRAIYITPLGAQSEFRRLDEGDLTTAFPAGHLPDRLVKHGPPDDPKSLPACASYVKDEDGYERSAPETHRDDRPAPFRYLVLTKHAPHRKQVGRMIERVNMTGVRRLYALKNWTVLQQAGTWLRVYGQQLDEAYLQWIDKTTKTRREYSHRCAELWLKIGSHVKLLTNPKARDQAQAALQGRSTSTQERAVAELLKVRDEYYTQPSIIRDTFSTTRRTDRNEWDCILDNLDCLRNAKEARDIGLAEHNQNAEDALINITSALDRLGKSAIGGLSYRISRSRYYAELYRNYASALRDGNIETWWSYGQFARRGMEPTLRFIKSIGERLSKLHDRLQSVKEDILESSISNQTESTRDNTHKLERIQTVLGRIATETERSAQRMQQARYVYALVLIGVAVAQFLFAAVLFLDRINADNIVKETAAFVQQAMDGVQKTVDSIRSTMDDIAGKIQR
jgi:hypothetical protein